MKTVLKVFLILLIPALVGYLAYNRAVNFFFKPFKPGDTTIQLVEIPTGSTFSSACKELANQGVIRSWRVLDIIYQLGKSKETIKAGEYELSAGMTPQEILKKLVSGDVFKRVLVVKEGYDIWQIAAEVEKARIATADEFLQIAQNKGLLERVSIDADSFEGYLFPETYFFSGKQPTENILWRMYEEFLKHWLPEYNDKSKEMNFTVHEIITLASVIEKESGNAEEQPKVSSVFHNRLKNGMRLESDPTLVYGVKDFNGVVLDKHKEIESPYNTYKNFGLPKGPIANPGKTAIEAALNPATTDYLYFVADGKGGHVFSTNLTDHINAVNAYRQAIRERTQQPQVVQ
jgi:UPF0755 protein